MPSLTTCLPRWRVVNGSLDRTVFNRELYGVWGGLSEKTDKNLSASYEIEGDQALATSMLRRPSWQWTAVVRFGVTRWLVRG